MALFFRGVWVAQSVVSAFVLVLISGSWDGGYGSLLVGSLLLPGPLPLLMISPSQINKTWEKKKKKGCTLLHDSIYY